MALPSESMCTRSLRAPSRRARGPSIVALAMFWSWTESELARRLRVRIDSDGNGTMRLELPLPAGARARRTGGPPVPGSSPEVTVDRAGATFRAARGSRTYSIAAE